MSILGLLTPFLLLTVYYYLKDISVEERLLAGADGWLDINFDFLNIPIQVVYMSLLAIYLIPSLFYTLSSRSNRDRKRHV